MSESTLALLVAAVGCIALGSGCLDRRDDAARSATEDTRCTSCHGDAKRAGDSLSRSAPPIDLLGASDPSYPGVGAHAIHLYASDTHGPVACNECHVVPERTDAPGHADSDRPAEIVFGAVARTNAHAPAYDALARSCSDSWCHRGADAVWTEPRSSRDACGSCHGLPPAAPHPQSDQCSACHAEVIDADRHFVAPALHVNGKVEVGFGKCSLCHGSGDDPAPPKDTLGNVALTAVGVGAHGAHLSGGTFSRPLACSECHSLPDTQNPEQHIDGLPALVTLTGVAETSGHTPNWNHSALRCSDSYCHSPSPGTPQPSPRWIDPTELSCTGCHGAPPAPPHPARSDCSFCHGAVIGPDNVTIIDPTRHVDGVVDLNVPQNCTSCHGSQNPAPPLDLAGNSSTTAAGVGAHQTHVNGTASSRAVPCAECHVVPADVLAPGHMDSAAPAEVIFSGAARAYGAAPSYAQGACNGTPCHGAVFPDGDPSGGTNNAPQWTRVDGTQAACGACHGLPPPRPHPLPTNCNQCHEDIGPDNQSFVHPELHVDGVVTFTVP